LLLIFSIFVNSALAQIYYHYDNNGNRTQQGISVSEALVKPKDTTKNDSNKIIATRLGVNVYPNPTSNEVNVAILNMQTCGFAMVYLLDATGNQLFVQKAVSSPLAVNLASNNQGVYYIRVVLCGEQLYYKVIKVSPVNSKVPPPAVVK
jgi:hypothetical protein